MHSMARTRRHLGVALAGGALVAAGLVAASAPATASAPIAHRVTPAVGVKPHAIPAGKAAPSGAVLFNCQQPGAGVTCYGPDQIRAAYAIQPLLDRGITGKGRTIVIIDAFAPPTVAADLHTFDTTWGLPDPKLSIIAPQGVPAFDPNDDNQVGWSGEIALDVQWAHVVAPQAKIVLVEARSNDDADILAATRYAVDHNLGDVISQSFGEDERCVDPAILKAQHALFATASRRGITLIASAGDQGSAQPTCDGSSYSLAASSPASDPYVLAIGGTSLKADPASGAYQSETVWNETDEYGAAGGGGYSVLYSRPDYQRGTVSRHSRGLPDVSYDGGINGGVLVYWEGGFWIFGGTSSGSPQWAGVTALAGQLAHHRLGLLQPRLYQLGRSRAARSTLHDIVVGDNHYAFTDDSGQLVTIPGYRATRGWDAATGLGTPIASGLVPFLASR
jgi:subtilase family serine protease